MDGTLFGWWITPHACHMLEERLVPLEQLADAILRPEQKDPLPGGGIYWTASSGVVWTEGSRPGVGDAIRVIRTVLLRGPGQVTWEDEAPYLSPAHDHDIPVVDLMQQEVEARTVTGRRKPTASKRTATRRGRPPVFPVEVRSIFDGVPERTMQALREQLAAMGRDPDDLSCVKRVGNSVEIM